MFWNGPMTLMIQRMKKVKEQHIGLLEVGAGYQEMISDYSVDL
jgi:hypothetical protein